MNKPSTDQARVINHFLGPATVIAGPGSGKTFTIVHRVKSLIYDHNIPPDNILVVTFSKKASREMYLRFTTETGINSVNIGTFHSIAFNILKQDPNFKNLSLITEFEKRKIISQILNNKVHKDVISEETVQDALNMVSFYKNQGDPENKDLKFPFDKAIIDEYDAFLRQINKLDFDDMIVDCLEFLRTRAKSRAYYEDKFKFIIIDEFQDINYPQYELIKEFAIKNKNIMAVGDDDQSIYAFRGTREGVFDSFKSDYECNTEFFLKENFRSKRNIVEFSDKVIKSNSLRIVKEPKAVFEGGKVNYINFSSYKEETDFIISLLKDMDEDERKNTAILVRNNNDLKLYKGYLSAHELKLSEYHKKDIRLEDEKIFSDIVSYLKFIFEKKKRSDFLKIMNKPMRYIQREALIDENDIFNSLFIYYQNNRAMLKTVKELENKINFAASLGCVNAVNYIANVLGYKECMSSDPDSEKKLDLIKDYFKDHTKGESIEGYILKKRSNILPDKEDRYERSEGINILTMHSSKGLEFDTVILPNVNEGIMPAKELTKKALEEERRLFYVALTRAKDNLYIFSTSERNRKVSSFIKDLI